MAKYDDKVTGNSVDATEYNQVVRPLKNMITSGGQSIVDGQNNQVGKSVANYAAGSNFFTDSGSGTAYVLSKVSTFNEPTVYTTGFQARFKAGSTNTASATINIETIGVKTLKKLNASGSKSNLVSGDIIQNRYYKCTYDGTDFVLFEDVLNSANNIRDRNLRLKNNVTNPNNQVDLTADFITVYNSSQQSLVVSVGSALVCDLAVSGIGGLDTGSEASDTWYYLYVVYNPATDDTKLLFSLSLSSPTLPTGYSYFRRVTDNYNNSSSHINPYFQVNNVKTVEVNDNRIAVNITSAINTTPTTLLSPIAIKARWTADIRNDTAVLNVGGVFIKNTSTSSAREAVSFSRVGSAANSRIRGNGECVLHTPQNIYIGVSGTDSRITVTVPSITIDL